MLSQSKSKQTNKPYSSRLRTITRRKSLLEDDINSINFSVFETLPEDSLLSLHIKNLFRQQIIQHFLYDKQYQFPIQISFSELEPSFEGIFYIFQEDKSPSNYEELLMNRDNILVNILDERSIRTWISAQMGFETPSYYRLRISELAKEAMNIKPNEVSIDLESIQINKPITSSRDLDEIEADDISAKPIDEFSITDSDPNYINEIFDFGKKIGSGVQGEVYFASLSPTANLPEDVDQMVVKRSRVVNSAILYKYILIYNYYNNMKDEDLKDKIYDIITSISIDEIYFLKKYGLLIESNPKIPGGSKTNILKIDLNNRNSVEKLSFAYYDLLYNYINNPSYEVNVDCIISYYTSRATEKALTIFYPLTYATFRTEYDKYDEISRYYSSVKDLLENNTLIPKNIVQYLVTQKLSYNLYYLIKNKKYLDYDINDHESVMTAVRRLRTILYQIVLGLWKGQELFNLVNNDAHAKNFLVEEVDETIEVCAVINAKKIKSIIDTNDEYIMNNLPIKEILDLEDNNVIVLSNNIDGKLIKQIDFGRAAMELNNGAKIGSTETLEVSKSYGYPDWNLYGRGNDLLNFCIGIHDTELLSYCKDSNELEAQLLYRFYRNVFSCKRENGNIQTIYDVRKERCNNDIECEEKFINFEIYSMDDSNVCNTYGAYPENNIIYFLDFINPTKKLSLKELCYYF